MNWPDLDWLLARIHAARNRVAEGVSLDALLSLGSLPELGNTLYPGSTFTSAAALQRRLLESLGAELWDARSHLSGEDRALIEWMAQRFYVENLKLFVRAIQSHAQAADAQAQVLSFPGIPAIDAEALLSAESLRAFPALLSAGPIRDSAASIVHTLGTGINAFFMEAALDRGYYLELLARAERLKGLERDLVRELVEKEIDIFHWLLIARGKFGYALPEASLLTLRVEGIRHDRNALKNMMKARDVLEAAKRAFRPALAAPISAPPQETEDAAVQSAQIELLAWSRLARLANRVFRRSHMGIAAVYAYGVIRRIEVANLTTTSEGIRLAVGADTVRRRIIRPEPAKQEYV